MAQCVATTGIVAGAELHFAYKTQAEWTAYGYDSTFTGLNLPSPATSSDCAQMGVTSSTCGLDYSTVRIHEGRFDNYSAPYKWKFLMHETGHAMGFKDYCNTSFKSVSWNGKSPCIIDGTGSSGFTSLDRSLLRTYIYKNK